MEGTVKDNLTYGLDKDISEEELIKACKDANAYDFIKELDGGFDHYLTNGGTNLSGGQKQSIAIARAFIQDKPYLLLDEATSNLDVHHEKEIVKAINKLSKGKTTIIIAHSLTTIKDVDNVVIINNGKVVEQGKFEDIIKKPNNYLAHLNSRAHLS